MFSTVIVIPSYNELPTLKGLVKKLNKNNILIIDDASTDGTSKFLMIDINHNKLMIGTQ